MSQRRASAARRRRIFLHQQVGDGQSGGFLSAFITLFGKFGLSTLAQRGAAQEVEMEPERKMALVDPRLLDTLRSTPPQPRDNLGKTVQALDEEMMSVLDRKDFDDRTKLTLYNQVLQRYNVLSNKYVKEPVRVVAVNESNPAAAAAAVGAIGTPSSGMAADVVDTVPKTMQARRLMERKRYRVDRSWRTDPRGFAG